MIDYSWGAGLDSREIVAGSVASLTRCVHCHGDARWPDAGAAERDGYTCAACRHAERELRWARDQVLAAAELVAEAEEVGDAGELAAAVRDLVRDTRRMKRCQESWEKPGASPS